MESKRFHKNETYLVRITEELLFLQEVSLTIAFWKAKFSPKKVSGLSGKVSG